jgi:acetyltransferase-like isoleucine patch superfamily enzyme
LYGTLTFESYLVRSDGILIKLGKGSALVIDGDFNIDPGFRVVVEEEASLHTGGPRRESLSGMAENSQIMVKRRIRVGTDLICSWRVFITDSDWHETFNREGTQDTEIGDHVWITPNCSILKGSRIGNGCILATGTVTHCESYPDNSLLGGQPARVLAANRRWCREMASDSEVN